jgi:hypothetical protein
MKKVSIAHRATVMLILLLSLFLTASVSLGAQSNDMIDQLLDEETASYGLAVYLIFNASGDIEEDADTAMAVSAIPALRWNIEPKDPEDTITLGEFSYLLMRSLDIEGGIMYSAFPGPRYATRELKYLGFVPGEPTADQPISGTQAVHILGKAMEWKETAKTTPLTDFGGFIDSSSMLVNSPNVYFGQQIKTGLWFDTRYSQGFGIYGRGSYRYNEELPFFADIDRLYISGRKLLGKGRDTGGEASALLRYSAGRVHFNEFSGYVLSHKLDGFLMGFEHPSFSLEGGAGYTGLTFVPSSTILVTQSDLLVQAKAPENGYGLVSPKIIETLKMRFPSLLFEQDLLFSIVAQQDLQREADLAATNGRIHTEYIGVGLRGGIAPSLYQKLFFYLNIGHGQYNTLGVLFGGALRYYNREFYFSRVELSGLYSSGDNDQGGFYGGYTGDGISSHFIGLSSGPGFGIVFSPEIGNISTLGLSLSMRPFSKKEYRALEFLQTEINTSLFFRNSGGAISENGIDPASGEHFLGTELDVTLRMRPSSDFGISLAGGLFFRNDNGDTSAFTEIEAPVEGALRLDLSFSF